MSKASGKLDGLHDIVDPLLPPASAGIVTWWVLLIAVVMIITVIYIATRRLRCQWLARRRFRQIARRAKAQTAPQTGWQLYLLLCRLRHVDRLRPADLQQLPAAQRQAWARTVAQCNRLRFSTHDVDPGLVGESLDMVRQCLWTR
jgi:hypothetical protein